MAAMLNRGRGIWSRFTRAWRRSIAALHARARFPSELQETIAALRHELDAANQSASELQKAGKWQEAEVQAEKSQNTANKLNSMLTQIDQYELRVANALWAEKGYPFQRSYLDTVDKFYHTGGAFPVDFKENSEPARLRINAWIEDQTHNRIRDLLPPGSVDKTTALVLTNAVYFKGEWKRGAFCRRCHQDR